MPTTSSNHTLLLQFIIVSTIMWCCMGSFHCAAQPFPNLQFAHIPVSGKVSKGKDGLVYITAGDIHVWDGFRARKVQVPENDNGKALGAASIIMKKGQLWINSRDGVSVYDSVARKRIVYSQTNTDARFRIQENSSCTAFEDIHGDIYIQGGAMYKVMPDFSLQEIKLLTKQMDSLKVKFSGFPLFTDRNNNEWVFFVTGKIALLNKDKTIRRYYEIPEVLENAFGMYQDSQDRYWLFCWNVGLLLFDAATGKCTPMNAGMTVKPILHDMCEWKDATGKNWLVIAADAGIYLKDINTLATKCYKRDRKETIRTALVEAEPSHLYVDDENILWIDTDQGDEMVIPVRQQFSNYSVNSELQFSRPPFPAKSDGDVKVIPNRISSVDGNIWAGGLYGKGVSIFTKGMDFITNYPNYTRTNTASDTAFKDFNYVVPLPDGKLLFSSYGYVGVWDKKNKASIFRDEKFVLPTGDYKSPNFTTILPLSSNQFLIKASDDIYMFDYRLNKLTQWFSLRDSGVLNTAPKALRTFQFTKTGFWILYEAALLRYDTATHKIKDLYAFEKEGANKFSTSSALKFVEDNTGKFWIITTESLMAFDPNTHQFTSYKNKYHLPSGYNNMLIDHQQRLWLQSGSTQLCFMPDKNETYSFVGDGALSGNGLYGIFQDSTDSRIWMASENAITIFHPDSVLSSRRQQQVYVSAVLQGDSAIEIDHDGKTLFRLPFDKSTVTFEAAFRFFDRVNPPLLAFRLHAEEPWKFSRDGNITFYNLGAGSYELQLAEAVDEGNVMEDKMLKVYFVITPPFYKTLWFLLACFILACSLAYVVFSLRIKTMKAVAREKQKESELLQLKTELEKQLAESEMAALRSQMNPHFIFNVLNSINRYILTADTDQASDYLVGFSRLIRLVLENSKSAKVSLEADLEALQLYIDMEKMRFGKKFVSEITVDKNIDQQFVMVPPLLIQPYIENAIWHGLMQKETGIGQLTINISQPDNNMLQIVITDNGIGRAKAAELKSKSAMHNKSFGMQITRDRIGIVNKLFQIETSITIQDLISEDGTAAGTEVSLCISI